MSILFCRIKYRSENGYRSTETVHAKIIRSKMSAQNRCVWFGAYRHIAKGGVPYEWTHQIISSWTKFKHSSKK